MDHALCCDCDACLGKGVPAFPTRVYRVRFDRRRVRLRRSPASASFQRVTSESGPVADQPEAAE